MILVFIFYLNFFFYLSLFFIAIIYPPNALKGGVGPFGTPPGGGVQDKIKPIKYFYLSFSIYGFIRGCWYSMGFAYNESP
jgi:hypothetical protein